MLNKGDHVIINYYIDCDKGVILKGSHPRYFVEFKTKYTVHGKKVKRWLSTKSISLDKEWYRTNKIDKILNDD